MRSASVPAASCLILCLAACSAVPPASEPEGMVACKSPRPEVCTLEYNPVCGIQGNQQRQEYPNACGACADLAVTGYIAGACAESPY